MDKAQIITLILDGRQANSDRLAQVIMALKSAQFTCHRLFVFISDTDLKPTEISLSTEASFLSIQWLSPSIALDFRQIETDWIGVMPQDIPLNWTLPCLSFAPGLIPWIGGVDFPLETAIEQIPSTIAWLGSTSLIATIFDQLTVPEDWTLLNVGRLLEQRNISFRWFSGHSNKNQHKSKQCTDHVRVLAIVPHFQCEAWLAQCLRSLVHQSRPLDGIVVIDDGSLVAPLEIVQQFPQVTLWAATETVGPYRLVQQVIETTDYDAYLFQDADDWSSCDRLEILLELMQATQADLVGTQEIRIYEEHEKITLGCYPLDVNAALTEKPGHPLLHPTSLIKRDLIFQVGGFATGLRFGGDTEFLLRASYVATIRNSPRFCYCRRKRSHSLTTDPTTGLDSPARQNLLQQVKQRANTNRERTAQGQSPDLSPLTIAPPMPLHHLAGPTLRSAIHST